jgi:hypothetical protein
MPRSRLSSGAGERSSSRDHTIAGNKIALSVKMSGDKGPVASSHIDSGNGDRRHHVRFDQDVQRLRGVGSDYRQNFEPYRRSNFAMPDHPA